MDKQSAKEKINFLKNLKRRELIKPNKKINWKKVEKLTKEINELFIDSNSYTIVRYN